MMSKCSHESETTQDILGIRNRTENWKTAKYFCHLSEGRQIEFVKSLVRDPATELKSVQMELFWRGVRDYRYGDIERTEGPSKRERSARVDKCLKESFWAAYIAEFASLRALIRDSSAELRMPKRRNYSSSDKFKDKLYNNLLGTEIDIVLESTDHLFIGEAKHESKFGRDGRLVLVHQLIRQYVAASLLMEVREVRRESTKEVVPFLVVDEDDMDSTMNSEQVKFMLGQDWLKEANIKNWTDVM